MKRPTRWGLGCLTLLLLAVAYRVFSVYEFRSGECQAPPAPRQVAQTYPRRLVVMTYNIQGHASLIRSDHIAEIADTIQRVRPDIVAINESHRRTWQSRFRDDFDELRRRTGMNAVFGESYEQLGGQFGNAILTRGHIVAQDLHKLPGRGEPRTLLEATIDIDGGRIEFYVTHLAAWEKLNRGIRGSQLDCLVEHVQASRHPFILAGDLNAPPDSPEIARFLQQQALQICGERNDGTHKVTEQRIDYILADRGWTVRTVQTLDTGPSDHRPVIAELVHDAQTQGR